jgi:hypothetical protein
MAESFECPFRARNSSGLQQKCVAGQAFDFGIRVCGTNGRNVEAIRYGLPPQSDISNGILAEMSVAVRTHQLCIAVRAGQIKEVLFEPCR